MGAPHESAAWLRTRRRRRAGIPGAGSGEGAGDGLEPSLSRLPEQHREVVGIVIEQQGRAVPQRLGLEFALGLERFEGKES